MAQQNKVHMDISKMKDLILNLRNTPVIQVGVFSGKAGRKKGGLDNADLAMYHELGSPKHGLPARSMLKTPIAEHAHEIFAPFKARTEALLQRGTLMDVWKLIGVAAEAIVSQAFTTGGFGKWAPLKENTVWRHLAYSPSGKKKSYLSIMQALARTETGDVAAAILIRTGQLRRAFASRVVMRF